jgi:hypothetical protein
MQNPSLTDPRLINAHALTMRPVAVANPVAAPRRDEEGFLCDPRTILDTAPLDSLDAVQVGMFLRGADWSRMRLVVLVEGEGADRVFTLADPSPRLNGKLLRRITAAEWARRPWVWCPGLTQVWQAAHGL